MIVVTAHAIVRWLERRHGYDMAFFRDAVPGAERADFYEPASDIELLNYLQRRGVNIDFFRRCILAEVGDVLAAGASSATYDGLRYKVREGKLVTVEPIHGSELSAVIVKHKQRSKRDNRRRA
jgi:hypothetical protein